MAAPTKIEKIKLRNEMREPRTYELPVRHGSVRQKVGWINRKNTTEDDAVVLQIERRQLPTSITFMALGTKGDTVEVEAIVARIEPFKSLIAKGELSNLDAPKTPATNAKVETKQLATRAPMTPTNGTSEPTSNTKEKPNTKGDKPRKDA